MEYITVGIMHPPPKTDPNYTGPGIRKFELGRIIRAFIDRPVKVEHSGPSIGIVRGFLPGSKGSTIAVLELYPVLAKDAIAGMESGKYMGLSMCALYFNSPDNKIWTGKDPLEISIVRKGAFDCTHLLCHGDRHKLYVFTWGMWRMVRLDPTLPAYTHTTVFKRMSETQPDLATAMAQIAALTQERDAWKTQVIERDQNDMEKEAEELSKYVKATILTASGMLGAPHHAETLGKFYSEIIGAPGASTVKEGVIVMASALDVGKKAVDENVVLKDANVVLKKDLEEAKTKIMGMTQALAAYDTATTKRPALALTTEAERTGKKPRTIQDIVREEIAGISMVAVGASASLGSKPAEAAASAVPDIAELLARATVPPPLKKQE